MTQNEFYRLSEQVLKLVKSRSPIDTGNLRYNAIQMQQISPTEIKIFVSTPIAPYMVYTNETWISPKWNGRRNPNERWWNNTALLIDELIKNETGAK